MTNIQKLCLVCMDRTGSNMISDRLNTHPAITFYNEVFHRHYIIFNDNRMAENPELIARRDRNPSAFVSQLWSGDYEPADDRPSIKAIGFKLFLNHNAEALKYVTNSDAKIVFLRRRNALCRFSSFKIATETKVWKTSEKSSKAHKILFNADEFRAYMQNYLSLETMYEMVLNRWNRAYIPIWYEDIVRNVGAWKHLTDYLGFDIDDFGESPLVKQNSSDVLSRFRNPQLVEEYARKIGKAEWLTE